MRDVLRTLTCSTLDPVSGGRHKVFGHPKLHIVPQTSTIASHLPRAVGLAVSLPRAPKLGVAPAWPRDSVVVCSFGDASANHSTATGAINTALHTAYQNLPVPVLFVCEDNGLGISVSTPRGWIQHAYGSRPGLAYYQADGFDLAVAPLTRLTCIRIAPDAYRFLWSYHHLLIDGWCRNLLLQEVSTVYDAFHNGHVPSLPSRRPWHLVRTSRYPAPLVVA